MSATKVAMPVDSRGNVISGGMGVPLVAEPTLQSATKWIDIFDLSGAAYRTRTFSGIAIRNPSASTTVEIAIGGAFYATKCIVCGTQEFFVIDDLMFGPAAIDDTSGVYGTHVRAKLGTAQGTAYTATITYTPNPTNGQSFNVNGYIYEFSDDGSLANPSSGNIIVAIAATADLTWTAAVAAINATDQAVTATINVGTNVVTITSNAGGTVADAIVTVDVDTAAVFSAATLGGGSGGVAAVIHIW